jgi:photosystem II stability/assembly factor-like uncharacterized protein
MNKPLTLPEVVAKPICKCRADSYRLFCSGFGRWKPALRVVSVFLFFALLLSPDRCVSAQQCKPPEFSAQARLQSHAQHLKMRESSPYKKLEWQHIGPTHMSGRVTDIAKPLDQPFTFYVTTASGGVWKTINEGTSWTPIFDDAPSAAWGAIAVDPSNSNTIWIGGGESNVFRSSMAGTGVYKSTDAGETWVHLGLGDTQHIARIVVHPTDSNIVYVAAGGHEYTPNQERGIFKTTNGGNTWKKVLYESELAAGNDLAIDPQNPDTIYASLWHRIRRPWNDPVPGPGGGIYKSTDAGVSWRRVSKGLPPRDTSGRIGLSLAASQPNVIYALIDNHEVARAAKEDELDNYDRPKKDVLKGAEVYRSDDRGESWSLVSETSPELEELFSTYGWVFGQIRVDPSDENTLYILGISLLKSTDGGRTYQRLFDRGLHADHHAMWIDPDNSNYIINGNDGGINLSYDAGQTWKNLENLPVVQFYNVALDNSNPFNVYGSVQDNQSWMGPSDHEPGQSEPCDWRRIPGGEASYHAIDPADQDTLYCESFYGSLLRSDLATKETKDIKPTPSEGEPPFRGQWLAPFMLSPHNSRVVYHGMNHVFRSMNRGDDWERISPDLSYNHPDRQGNISFATITSLSESPLKFGLLYAGTDDGRVHVTKNSGQGWSEILGGIPQHKWVSRVVASRFDEGTVYLTQNGKRDNDFQVYVYRSANYGEAWEDISPGIPGGPVNVIAEDPFDSQVLYVGTDMGVYVTTDGAKTWNVLGSQLPITFAHDIAIHAAEKTLVIATHGRGVWKIGIRPIERRLKLPSKEEKQEDGGQ